MVNKIIINNSITLKKLTLKYINQNYLSWLDDANVKKKSSECKLQKCRSAKTILSKND